MPAFPIVDTHLHVWNLRRLSYPWLATVPTLNRDFSITDFREACGRVEVAKMVFIQCECLPSQYLDELAWVSEVAETDPRLRGIVPWAPLEQGSAVEPELAQLASNPRVKGIRRIIQFEPDPAFCLRPDFIRGVQLLPRHGLTFDLCIHHTQLSSTLKLVRECPEVRFIMDHIAKPDIKARRLDPWREEIRALAALPNVWCKLSGLVTEADHQQWQPSDLQPYVDHVFECFGFDRVLFGGDWPVASQATDYPRWVDTLDAALHGSSPDELHRLYVRNAEMFYRI